MEILWWVIGLIVIGVLVGGGIWLVRGYLMGGSSGGVFGGGREKRIGVVQTASVDGRRKLVLVQRDGVEHLIMTGGPVDVLVETGIRSQRVATPSFDRGGMAGPGERPQPEFSRPRVAGGTGAE